MSRHVFNEGNIRTVIGWDPMLRTFFCQRGVINPETDNWVDDDHGPEIWLGIRFEEIPTKLALVSACWDHNIKLDSEVFKLLENDQDLDV